MKKFLWMLSALLAMPAAAQQYTVSGVAPKGVTKVYLYHLEANATDSAAVQNGKFSFAGDAGGMIFGAVGIHNDNPVRVILEGDVVVDLTARTATGNAENDGLTEWEARYAEPKAQIAKVMEEYVSYRKANKEVPDSVMDRINAVYDAAVNQLNELVKTCCTTNRDKKFPAMALAGQFRSMDKADVVKLAEEGNPVYMETRIMKNVKARLEGMKRQIPGTLFADLEMADTLGQTHKLSEFVGKGKYVLVDFWASWCGPCRQEMPHVKRVYDAFKDKGFDIVGLSFDNDAAAWKGSIKKLELPWHHLSDLKGWQSIASSTYGIDAIPATILFDPEGKVVVSGLRGEELEKKLQELLK